MTKNQRAGPLSEERAGPLSEEYLGRYLSCHARYFAHSRSFSRNSERAIQSGSPCNANRRG